MKACFFLSILIKLFDMAPCEQDGMPRLFVYGSLLNINYGGHRKIRIMINIIINIIIVAIIIILVTSISMIPFSSLIFAVEKFVWAPAPFHSPYNGITIIIIVIHLVIYCVMLYLHWFWIHCHKKSKVLKSD